VSIADVQTLRRIAREAISADRVVRAVGILAGTPSPRGHERELAELVVAWAAEQWPGPRWASEPVSATGANLVAASVTGDAPELLVYSHLDTSLSGDADLDELVTGLATPVGPLAMDEAGSISGFGLGVAKGPAAAALTGYAAAVAAAVRAGLPHRLTLLLASAGTHRSPWESGRETGVECYLRTHPRPAAAIVAKGGPAGVLSAEPGAMFVRVGLRTRFHPVLARDAALPPGGLLAHLGIVLGLIEQWRAEHLAARPAGRVAAEVGIGAVRGGLPGKPDLLPGLVELHLYVVTMPGDDARSIADALRRKLTTGLDGGPLAACSISVDAHLAHPAAETDPGAPIVRHAVAAWTAAHGTAPRPITGWKGSTDGVVLRSAGIDTVRLGPASRPDPLDPRRDAFEVDELLCFAEIYADIAIRHICAGIAGMAQPDDPPIDNLAF
jgi:acetylornithine deacetylase/succinyl-diaminopimelate desuccinylase-like protein